MHKSLYFLCGLLVFVGYVNGHARLMQPPSRASMWRKGFDNPPDYQDNEGFCGGFDHQFNEMEGKCGICGDAWDANPREHEVGGIYANGIIVETYTKGQVIDVTVDVTANHKGYFVFKMCANNDVNQDPIQECFDKTILKVHPTGEERYYLPNINTVPFDLQLQLPEDTVCEQCIIQWTYTAGNSWGNCEDGHGENGCGNQETFRACADIAIIDKSGSSSTTTSTTTTKTSSTSTVTDKTSTPSTTSTTTTATTTTSSGGNFNPDKCKATGDFFGDDDMDFWCQTNCPSNCPQSLCDCGAQKFHKNILRRAVRLI